MHLWPSVIVDLHIFLSTNWSITSLFSRHAAMNEKHWEKLERRQFPSLHADKTWSDKHMNLKKTIVLQSLICTVDPQHVRKPGERHSGIHWRTHPIVNKQTAAHHQDLICSSNTSQLSVSAHSHPLLLFLLFFSCSSSRSHQLSFSFLLLTQHLWSLLLLSVTSFTVTLLLSSFSFLFFTSSSSSSSLPPPVCLSRIHLSSSSQIWNALVSPLRLLLLHHALLSSSSPPPPTQVAD